MAGLLDVPEEVLIKILSYFNGKTLIEMTQVCRRFEKIVGEAPELMEKIQLIVDVKFDREFKRFQEQHKFYMKSTRKYSAIKVVLGNFYFCTYNVDYEGLLDLVLKKHSQTIKKVLFELHTEKAENCVELKENAMKYFRHFPNAEEIMDVVHCGKNSHRNAVIY